MHYPNINAERRRKGMTIADLANALGVTRKTIYNWMAHGSIPQSALEKMEDSDNFKPSTSVKEKIFKKFKSFFD